MNTTELSPGYSHTAENQKPRPSALGQLNNVSRVLEIQASMQVSAPKDLFNKVCKDVK